MATDFAIVVSGLGLVGDGYDDERGAALHRIRDRMASLEEQVETLQREQTALDGESVRLNRENRELKEQLEASQKALLAILQDPLGSHGAKAVARQALGIPYPETSNPASDPRIRTVTQEAATESAGYCGRHGLFTGRMCPGCAQEASNQDTERA